MEGKIGPKRLDIKYLDIKLYLEYLGAQVAGDRASPPRRCGRGAGGRLARAESGRRTEGGLSGAAASGSLGTWESAPAIVISHDAFFTEV